MIMKLSTLLMILAMALTGISQNVFAATAYATVSARVVPAPVMISIPAAVTITDATKNSTPSNTASSLRMRNAGGYAYTVSVNRSVNVSNTHGDTAIINNLDVSTTSAASAQS